jgi:hypothetical protein
MFSPITFWLSFSGLFAIITICAVINASLDKHLKILLPTLKEKVLPKMRELGHDSQARDLSKERIPVLQNWQDAAIWYSLITLVLQFLLLLAGGFVVWSNRFPYILLMIIVMLLGSMVMFFPRTLIRRYNTRKAIGFYFLAYAGLMKEQQERDDVLNANNIGEDSHI